MYSNSKDQKALEEAYKKMFLTEEEDPSEYNSRYYDESIKNHRGTEDEWPIEHEGRKYYVGFNYDFDEQFTPASADNPPEYNYVDKPEFTVTSIWYDSLNGDEGIDVSPERDMELFNTIAQKAEADFMSDSGNYTR